MNKINPALEIERLIQFGQANNMIGKWDVVPVRNALIDLLHISEPHNGEGDIEIPETPVEILNNILDYAAEVGILPENTVTYRDLMDAKIMGLLMPRQSEVVERFWQTEKQHSIQEATDQYYKLSKSSNYIRTDRIAKNLYWKTPAEYGDIEITVNLSKPEKDPKAIAAAREMKQTNYPKCLLCFENVGYSGRVNHPARQNHRVIPIELNGEQWFLQYSPYVYYNEHSIVFYEKHSPMKISKESFKRLLDFVEQVPHYFLGSNADLPIVGGSILSHDHFQGGHHTFAMEAAKVDKIFNHSDFPSVQAGIVKWPMSVIRLSGEKKDELINMAEFILNTWKEYSDSDADILAYTLEQDTEVPHNTITPIARKNKQGQFELDLVLRNNRTSEHYPDGIFHPHKELHHIKKENIGLIEVMGLAVLPGRLDTEIKLIEEIITGQKVYDETEIGKDELLAKHLTWIMALVKKYGMNLDKKTARELLEQEIGTIFVKVLEDAGVYKRDEKGKTAFIKFMNSLGFEIEK